MDAPHAAWLFLRAHHEGTLALDGEVEKTRFIIDGATGRIVFPVAPAALLAEEVVIFIPEEAPQVGPELQLLLLGEALDADSEAADRWKAYHAGSGAEPRLTRWMTTEIDSGRFEGAMVDGEALRPVNPLRPAEPRLCKRLNADKAALARAAERLGSLAAKEPLAVGVDPTGIDIRARFGIIHAPFPSPLWTEAEASAEIDRLLGSPP